MASQNGKDRSYRLHVFKTSQQEAQSKPSALRNRQLAEQRKQASWMPGPKSQLERQRQEFLLNVLLDPQIPRTRRFGIQWNPKCEWAKGHSIHPFADIFSRFVAGVWNVRVVDDIEDTGSPGWIFERL